MRMYKLAYSGISGLGQSVVQIIASGRVKNVQMCAVIQNANANAADQGLLQVGVAAIDERGFATAAPVNFAAMAVAGNELIAGVNNMFAFNLSVPCDYPVPAGGNFQLNLSGLTLAGSTWEDVNVIIWVQ